ncbi:MAG TPA: ATP-binding protein [Solirubrobacterales bacterium]|nr:ATP-binding protein [Solirubrobacterales bacterium]
MPYPPFHPRRSDLRLALDPADFKREFPNESKYVEFKRGIGNDSFKDTVVSFSNADGGVILVGVEDDGTIVGKKLDAGTEDAIHEAIRNVRDPGRYSLHELSVGGRPIVAVSVDRRHEGFSQTSGAVVKVRKGTRDESLFGTELQRFVTRGSAKRYELNPTELPVGAVDPERLAEIQTAFEWRSNEVQDRLEEARLVAEGHLTVSGAMCLVADPSTALGKVYVELLRFRGDDSADYDLRIEFRGSAQEQIRNAAARILEEVGTELVVLGIRRYDLPRLPREVIREGMANAVAHRDYELDRTPIKVEIRPSSVVIRSPGRLLEPVTVENMRETNAARNVQLIRVLRRLDLAEDEGRGVDLMEDEMAEEMLDPPRFEEFDHGVRVTLPLRSAVAPAERAWIKELEHRGSLRAADRLLLVHAARGEALTNAKAREILQVDRDLAREALQRLRGAGFVRQKGQRGGATYHLEGSLAPPAGLRLDRDELAAAIEAMAAERPITNAMVRDVTGLGRGEVKYLLKRLVDEGRLVKVGERRGTRYRLPSY